MFPRIDWLVRAVGQRDRGAAALQNSCLGTRSLPRHGLYFSTFQLCRLWGLGRGEQQQGTISGPNGRRGFRDLRGLMDGILRSCLLRRMPPLP